MPTIKTTHSRVRHLAGRDINIQHGATTTIPPEGASHVLTCPQCGQRTWLHSRYCVHCALDLWLWRAGSAVMTGVHLAAAAGAVLGYLLLASRQR